MTPYYDHKGITIYHGDCREILPTLESESVDLVLTDPPYGINGKPNNQSRGRGNRPHDRFQQARDMPPVYGDGSPFDPQPLLRFDNLILWGANHYANRLPPSSFWLAWDRKTERGAASDITDVELAWTRGRHYVTTRLFRHMWAGYQRDSESGHKHLHPTQKPIALMKWCLGWFPDSTNVLDPFMGSGTTLRAAKDLGRRAIGIEIEERYCEIAAERLRQEVLFS